MTTDLTGRLLFMMARQAVHLQRSDEVLRLVRVGQATSQGPHQVSPSTATALFINLACAYAAQGDRRHTERALGDAEHPALIEATRNPRAMSVAMYLPGLAGAHALTSDVDAAVEVGHRAADPGASAQVGAGTHAGQPWRRGAARTASPHRRLIAPTAQEPSAEECTCASVAGMPVIRPLRCDLVREPGTVADSRGRGLGLRGSAATRPAGLAGAGAPGAPAVAHPAPASLYVPRAQQRSMTIRPPSPDRARVRANRLATRPSG